VEIKKEIINWLLEGDVSVRWHTMNSLLDTSGEDKNYLQKKIATEGWGARLLSYQDTKGMWGNGIYSPKWISTTYTMLTLKLLGLHPDTQAVNKTCKLLIDKGLYSDGGINYFRSLSHSETCVTGLILSIVSYFKYSDNRINSLFDYLIHQQMKDGGWNCQSYKGDTHSSFHTTMLVLEGLYEYEKLFPQKKELSKKIREKGHEFLLRHKLFRSHRTGKVVDQKMTRFSFPPQWRYDIMRILDYFQESNAKKDSRMEDAIAILIKKQMFDGRWKLQNRHPGKSYFEMEKAGQPSRWNTLRALRILQWWEA